jgi:hypothetical protein
LAVREQEVRVCAAPLLEMKPTVMPRMPVVKPAARTVPIPQLQPPAPACREGGR